MSDRTVYWFRQGELAEAARAISPGPEIAGTFSTTSPSQYDVPEGIVTYVDPKGQAIVELKYIGPDEPMTLVPTDGAQVCLGANSGRIYGFISNVAYPTLTLGNIHQAISTVAVTHPRTANYKVVEFALDKVKDAVFGRNPHAAAIDKAR